jgi:steroid delta-isomerase-like uncharacterized protein
MTREDNKEIIRRFFNIVNARDMHRLDEICHKDMTYRTSAGAEYKGLDSFRELMNESFQTFSDLEMSIEEMAGEGERVTCLYRWGGVNDGGYQGMAPTNQRVDLLINSFCTVENGKVRDVFDFFDSLGFLRQLGVVSSEVYPGGEDWPRQGEKLRLYS